MIKKFIKYFYPEKDSQNQLISCMEQLFDFLSIKKFTLRNILFVNIFFDCKQEDFNEIIEIERQMLKFRLDVPIAKIPQKPEHYDFVFEVWFITGDYHTANFGDNFKIIRRDDLFVLYASIFNCAMKDENFIEKTFEDVKYILGKNKFSVDSIVRQWNYIGNILYEKNGTGNYVKLIKGIKKLYKSGNWKDGYPCTNSIGLSNNSLNLSFIAIRGHRNYEIFSLNNSIVNKADDKNLSLCEKGKIIITNDNSDIFISGISSFNGQNDNVENDVIFQTSSAIENIKRMLEIQNIKTQIDEKYYDRFDEKNLIKSFSYLRVYLKNIDDMEVVTPFIFENFGYVPTLYLQADLSQKELLIEIEGAIFL